ncbi:hypothetical protein [Cohnella hongkongensis]|uniref:Uncharacterized protein n=1 Tax=Cohnella hongkongensis TaxID=178337 RepID=A0ABV9FD89_9BACL
MKYRLPRNELVGTASIAIYGTGEIAHQYMDQLEESGEENRVVCFVNTYPSECKKVRGKPVFSLEDVQNRETSREWLFLIASYGSAQYIADGLRGIGIEEDKIVLPAAAAMGGETAYFPLLRRPVQHLVIYPRIEDEAADRDMEARLDWYLPTRKELTVFKPGSAANDQEWLQHFEASDLILVWQQQRLGDRLLEPFKQKIVCVDPEYSTTLEILTYIRLHYRTLAPEQRKALLDQYVANFMRMKERFSGSRLAYVFGTGPSLEKAWEEAFETSSVKIVCNSIVKNPDLVKRLDPDILVYSDPLWHSHTRYGVDFRKKVVEFLSVPGRYCVVPEMNAALLLGHYPELQDRIIGIPVVSPSFNFPSAASFTVMETYNVITRLGLTVASSLAGTVHIMGCDGSPRKDVAWWKRSSLLQEDTVQDEVRRAHESFFRLNTAADYFDRHNDFMERLIEYGESQGITYRSITPSYIPALSKREIR